MRTTAVPIVKMRLKSAAQQDAGTRDKYLWRQSYAIPATSRLLWLGARGSVRSGSCESKGAIADPI